MINAWFYSIVSVIIVSLVSLIGVIVLSVNPKILKSIIFALVSFSAGALFGDAFIHLLPEAVEEFGFGVGTSFYLLSGIILFFMIEKFIHWHHCHLEPMKNHPHPFVYMNLLGDAVHNFIDGLIIGASYLVSLEVGIATTLAVILHEIPQEIGDFGILLHGGFSVFKALIMNLLVALTSVLGAVLTLIMSSRITNLESFLIPFAAGGFIYIAGSDLIPELHKELSLKKSVMQLFTFIFGMVIMYGLLFIEG